MKKQLVLFALIFAFIRAYGQNIEYIRESLSDPDAKKYLDFKSGNGELLKRVDIESINPYKKQSFKARTADGTETNLDTSDFFSEGIPSNITSAYVAVTYTYSARVEEELHSDLCEASIYIFDSLGNISQTVELHQYAVSEPLVADNGRYLAVSYGGMWDGGGSERTNVGFNVYDIKSGDLVFKMNNLPRVAGLAVDKDIMKFRVPEPKTNGGTTYYIFDAETASLYKRTFSKNENSRIRRFSDEGCVLVTGAGDVVLTYSEEFDKVE